MKKKVKFWSSWFKDSPGVWNRPVSSLQLWIGWIALFICLAIMKYFAL